MKKQRILATAIFILILSSCSKDFQSSNWGDSIEKVKLSENAQEWNHSDSPDGTQTAIFYEGQIENLPAIILFAFSKNELIWGKHVFTEQHPKRDQYHSDYITINSALRDKFGIVPVEYMFSTDKYKESPEQWGEAIYQGDLLVQTTWENKRSEVLHAIFGANGEVTHEVEYQSIQSTK